MTLVTTHILISQHSPVVTFYVKANSSAQDQHKYNTYGLTNADSGGCYAGGCCAGGCCAGDMGIIRHYESVGTAVMWH